MLEVPAGTWRCWSSAHRRSEPGSFGPALARGPSWDTACRGVGCPWTGGCAVAPPYGTCIPRPATPLPALMPARGGSISEIPLFKIPGGWRGLEHQGCERRNEAGELRVGPTGLPSRAGHQPSAGHRPGGDLPWQVRGIDLSRPCWSRSRRRGQGRDLPPRRTRHRTLDLDLLSISNRLRQHRRRGGRDSRSKRAAARTKVAPLLHRRAHAVTAHRASMR